MCENCCIFKHWFSVQVSCWTFCQRSREAVSVWQLPQFMSSKGKIRDQITQSGSYYCWVVMQNKPPGHVALDERDLCCVMSSDRGRAGWAVHVSRRQMQCQECGVTVSVPSTLAGMPTPPVLFSKQSLGNRFSVINAFNCENAIRSGKQEQLLSDIQTITSFTPPGFPGACETDAATSCGKV